MSVRLFENQEEFILFLFIHIASADFSVGHSEVDVILAKMEDIFPVELDIHDYFIIMKDYYDKLNNDTIEKVIVENFRKFKLGLSNTDRILNDIYEIISADGIIQETETAVIDKLRKMLKGI